MFNFLGLYYIIVLIISVSSVVLSYSYDMLWLCLRRQHRFKYWHGIWTIILLMFVMTVDTSFSLVYCRVLNYHSGDVSVRTNELYLAEK